MKMSRNTGGGAIDNNVIWWREGVEVSRIIWMAPKNAVSLFLRMPWNGQRWWLWRNWTRTILIWTWPFSDEGIFSSEIAFLPFPHSSNVSVMSMGFHPCFGDTHLATVASQSIMMSCNVFKIVWKQTFIVGTYFELGSYLLDRTRQKSFYTPLWILNLTPN